MDRAQRPSGQSIARASVTGEYRWGSIRALEVVRRRSARAGRVADGDSRDDCPQRIQIESWRCSDQIEAGIGIEPRLRFRNEPQLEIETSPILVGDDLD